jgi:hypothetical protein
VLRARLPGSGDSREAQWSLEGPHLRDMGKSRYGGAGDVDDLDSL